MDRIINDNMEFTKIPFDLKTIHLIDNNIWHPVESDKKYMSQIAFDEAMAKYKKENSELLFTNTTVNYDSCDCGDGYGCSHPAFPIEIKVKDTLKNLTYLIEIVDDDGLGFNHNGTSINISGLKNFTYSDFIRFCKLCDINLESKYVL